MMSYPQNHLTHKQEQVDPPDAGNFQFGWIILQKNHLNLSVVVQGNRGLMQFASIGEANGAFNFRDKCPMILLTHADAMQICNILGKELCDPIQVAFDPMTNTLRRWKRGHSQHHCDFYMYVTSITKPNRTWLRDMAPVEKKYLSLIKVPYQEFGIKVPTFAGHFSHCMSLIFNDIIEVERYAADVYTHQTQSNIVNMTFLRTVPTNLGKNFTASVGPGPG